jgi:hypothetical protein
MGQAYGEYRVRLRLPIPIRTKYVGKRLVLEMDNIRDNWKPEIDTDDRSRFRSLGAEYLYYDPRTVKHVTI